MWRVARRSGLARKPPPPLSLFSFSVESEHTPHGTPQALLRSPPYRPGDGYRLLGRHRADSGIPTAAGPGA